VKLQGHSLALESTYPISPDGHKMGAASARPPVQMHPSRATGKHRHILPIPPITAADADHSTGQQAIETTGTGRTRHCDVWAEFPVDAEPRPFVFMGPTAICVSDA
jgi:hypothetical protein